jgi:hypothetical protein
VNKLIIYGFSALVLPALAQTADPTTPEVALQASTASQQADSLPVLGLIRSQGTQYLAVLDGELVRTGQLHRGYLVTQIRASDVTVQRGHAQWQLSLFPKKQKTGLQQTGHH